MSGSSTDRTEPQSRKGAGEAGFGAESPMQDKASCLSKWLSAPRRAYPVHIRRLDMAEQMTSHLFGHSQFFQSCAKLFGRRMLSGKIVKAL